MEKLLPLASFAFVASITPGPNNLMLAASGVGFGLRRTLPLLFGVCAGFALLLLACGLGVGTLLERWPAALPLLKAAGTAYLVWLAWKIRGSLRPGTHPASERPISFLAGAAFQFVNPKAWLMGITAAAAFLPGLGADWQALALMCAVACTVNLPCVASWAVLGSSIRATLTDPRGHATISAAIAALTIYAAIAIWL